MSAAYPEDVFSGLQGPLLEFMLCRLSAPTLAHLRRVNKAAQNLVDQQTGSIWKAAASKLLNPACLRHAADSASVQHILKEQAALRKNLLTGTNNCCKCLCHASSEGSIVRCHKVNFTQNSLKSTALSICEEPWGMMIRIGT